MGGYGLVNYPAILCNKNSPQIDGKTIYKNDYVSKATIMMEALTEYVVAKIIKSNIGPEYEKYFVLPISEPCPVTRITTITEDDIQSKYNYNPDFFKEAWLSHLPYGGFNGSSYIQTKYETAEDENNMLSWYNALDTIKTNLLDAFENGLLPLNGKRIFHGDLKLDNILIDSSKFVRFTDWGISTVPLKMVDEVELSNSLIAKMRSFLEMHKKRLNRYKQNAEKNRITIMVKKCQDKLDNIDEWLIYEDDGLKNKARKEVKKSINDSCVGENTPLRKELFECAEEKKNRKILMKIANTLQIALAYKPDNLYKEIEERKEKEKEDKEFDIWGLVMIFGEILRDHHSRLLLHTRIQISEAIIALYKDSSKTDEILDALKNIQFTSGREDVIEKKELDVINSVFLKKLDTRFGADALKIITEFNNTCTKYSLHLECIDINDLDTLHLILKEEQSDKIRYEIDYLYYQSRFENDIIVSCTNEEDYNDTRFHELLISVIVLVVPLLFKGATNTIKFKVNMKFQYFFGKGLKVFDEGLKVFDEGLKVFDEGLKVFDKGLKVFDFRITENSIKKATDMFEAAKKVLCPAAVPTNPAAAHTAAPPANPAALTGTAAPPTGGKRRTTKRKTRRSRRRKSSHRKSNRHRRHRRHSRRQNVRTRR
jgi:serine/threonine protein kinase